MLLFVEKTIKNTQELRHEKGIKKPTGYSHRTATTAYPCYLPVLGEFSRSWSCKTCRAAKVGILY